MEQLGHIEEKFTRIEDRAPACILRQIPSYHRPCLHTEVGGREEAREREKEWERRNDQAGEELLGH